MAKIIKNSLGFDNDVFVYQDKDMFNYSIDTILLGNFVTLSKKTKKILDIGTNNGALAIFLSLRKNDLEIDAIEIQEKAIKLAKKNLDLNNLNKRINLIHDDFNDYYLKHNKMQLQKYDSIVCNPPFYKIDSTNRRKGSEDLYIATHEVKMNLEQLIKGSSKILKQKGYLNLVMPTERLVDIFELMRKYGFEPKKVQFIHPRINDKSNLVLVEGRYKAGWGTHFLPNIYLHTENSEKHEYRDETKKLYKPIIFKKEEENE